MQKIKRWIAAFFAVIFMIQPITAMAASGYSPFMGTTPYVHDDKFEGRNIVHGIDVSKYQYDIDWKKVKESGVEYAFIRVGYRGYGTTGAMATDPYFVRNIEGAIMAGIIPPACG